MNYLQQVLNQFGLTDNEVAVYLETLKHNETSPYAISRATHIPRTTVYDVLMSLSLKGLITLIQSDGITKQQTRIKAKNPSELRKIIHQKQQDLGVLDVAIVDILPQLKNTYHHEKPHADFQFLPGIKGAAQAYFMDYAKDSSQPVIAFENMMSMDAFGKEAVNQDVVIGTAAHLQQQTRIRELIPLTNWTKHVLSYQYGLDQNYLVARDMRFIENPCFDLNQRIVIQGNRLAIACVKDDEAWGQIINSVSLAQTLTSIFEVLWLQATPITPTFVKTLGKNNFLIAEKKQRSRSYSC